MRHRGQFSVEERKPRSQLLKLLSQRMLVRGSLVTMARSCGKESCKCLEGEKHVSLYLSVKVRQGKGEAKRKMIYVPTEWEERVRTWVDTYQQSEGLLDRISEQQLVRFLRDKDYKTADTGK